MKRLRALWQSLWGEADRRVRLGRILGLTLIAAGFIAIFKAWDGAAEINLRVDSQFPYLLSGGFAGLGMIVTGATLLFLSAVRAERQVLSDRFDVVATLLARNLARLGYSSNGAGGELVVPGPTVYHRPECKVLQGKETLTQVGVEQAVAEGLKPCRVCKPPLPEEKVSEEAAASSQAAPTEQQSAPTAGSATPAP